jgi:hypothetical protein
LVKLRGGDLDAAADDWQRARRLEPGEPVHLYHLAKLQAARAAVEGEEGKRNEHLAEALHLLEEAARKGFTGWRRARADRDLQPLRREPRFQKLLPRDAPDNEEPLSPGNR